MIRLNNITLIHYLIKHHCITNFALNLSHSYIILLCVFSIQRLSTIILIKQGSAHTMDLTTTPKSDIPDHYILGSHQFVPDISNTKESNQRLSYISSNNSVTIDSTFL